MVVEFPPTQFYILLAITFTGLSIAVTIQRGLKALERRSKPTKAMRSVGYWTMLLSWLNVTGLVLMQLVEEALLHRIAQSLYLLAHFVVLILVGLFAYQLVRSLSLPEGTSPESAKSNVLGS